MNLFPLSKINDKLRALYMYDQQKKYNNETNIVDIKNNIIFLLNLIALFVSNAKNKPGASIRDDGEAVIIPPNADKGVLSNGINKQNKKNKGFSLNNRRDLFIDRSGTISF